ncbi:MAG: hypothetical protein HWE08_04935 [Alphaproteobacteria bacterium]|nr:hypothetical protein [Alphaproteobacteria bacterium]
MTFQSKPRARAFPAQNRDMLKAVLEIYAEAVCTLAGRGANSPPEVEDIIPRLENWMITACWTLRRLPDREAGFLRLRGALWPETAPEAGTYAGTSVTSFQARRRVRISAEEIDRMQPTLDLLLLLPDVADRRLLFWAAWHQEGEVLARIPWAKVRRSLDLSASRWTLKRQYQGALEWLARLVLLQGEKHRVH